MTTLTDAQAALVASNTVLTDAVALAQKMRDMQNMLEQAQASAVPVTPAIMIAKRTIIDNQTALVADITAAVAAVQVVVTGLGG